MALFVHLTPRPNITRVQRSGVRPSNGHGDVRGVFCFPLLPSYSVTHQWFGALGPHHGPHGLVAVDVRLPDDEPVTVGHFDDRDARRVTAAEAVRVVRELEDPGGWEVVVPRPVLRGEVQRIREVRWTTGYVSALQPRAQVVPDPLNGAFPRLRPEPMAAPAEAVVDLGRAIPEQVRGD
ncbi:hypothetical protein [Nocardiopsis sp. MG754419]|uniref:hypothetical protein n=1 Tax=Nocardiopsis sp. MG754419 TaxID=2259865 RepID=UPI001BAABB07|nr:hypothetical protein [Nocardiopsis sp. MG754419]